MSYKWPSCIESYIFLCCYCFYTCTMRELRLTKWLMAVHRQKGNKIVKYIYIYVALVSLTLILRFSDLMHRLNSITFIIPILNYNWQVVFTIS